VSAAHAPGGRPARPPAALQTTTDASEQNNTGPLHGPVKTDGRTPLIRHSIHDEVQAASFLGYEHLSTDILHPL